MAQIIGHNTSHSAWSTLEKTFSSSSRARIMQLHLELQTLKKGSMSMIDYMMKLKGISDSLAAIRGSMSEQDQIMNLLTGLGTDYNDVVTSINSRDDRISLETVHSMLLSYEHKLEQQNVVETIIIANYESSLNIGGGRNSNGGRVQGLNSRNYGQGY
ncbi:hypothetical protein UlMin_010513 [Ulmus minor]